LMVVLNIEYFKEAAPAGSGFIFQNVSNPF
jgi:hypothetical protein